MSFLCSVYSCVVSGQLLKVSARYSDCSVSSVQCPVSSSPDLCPQLCLLQAVRSVSALPGPHSSLFLPCCPRDNTRHNSLPASQVWKYSSESSSPASFPVSYQPFSPAQDHAFFLSSFYPRTTMILSIHHHQDNHHRHPANPCPHRTWISFHFSSYYPLELLFQISKNVVTSLYNTLYFFLLQHVLYLN